MKTPMQELLDYTTYLIHTVDSEERVAIAVLDYLRTNKKAMLEKEKEVMCEFADDYQRNCFQKSTDDYYNETFNTKRNEQRSIQQIDGVSNGNHRTTDQTSQGNQPQSNR